MDVWIKKWKSINTFVVFAAEVPPYPRFQPLRILYRALIWYGESCSDSFEIRLSTNFTESLNQALVNSIIPQIVPNVAEKV